MADLVEPTTEQIIEHSRMWYHNPVNIILAIISIVAVATIIAFAGQAADLKKIMAENKNMKHYISGMEADLKAHQYVPENSSKVYNYILHYYKKTPPLFAKIISIRIIEQCEKHNIDPAVVVGIIEQESGFDPYSVSKVKARGLMQVRYSVWGEQLEIADQYALHEIDTGIDAGIKVLKNYLISNEGDLAEALYLYVGKDRKYVKDVYANIGKFGVFGSLKGEGENEQASEH